MIVLWCFVVCAATVIACTAIVTKWGATSATGESELLRAAYRQLETQTRAAQESSTLAMHNLQELRERLSEQRDADRARISRCEVQGEANERKMTKLETQFKDEVAKVQQEGTKLSMLASNQQRRGL